MPHLSKKKRLWLVWGEGAVLVILISVYAFVLSRPMGVVVLIRDLPVSRRDSTELRCLRIRLRRTDQNSRRLWDSSQSTRNEGPN